MSWQTNPFVDEMSVRAAGLRYLFVLCGGYTFPVNAMLHSHLFVVGNP